jgi:hypothetical protein
MGCRLREDKGQAQTPGVYEEGDAVGGDAPRNVGPVLQKHFKDLDVAAFGQVVNSRVALVVGLVDKRDWRVAYLVM